MKAFYTLLFIGLSFISEAQDANVILNKVIAKLNTVNDYTVQATIKADIPMIKILPSQAKIYFKQKDKFKVESKGMAASSTPISTASSKASRRTCVASAWFSSSTFTFSRQEMGWPSLPGQSAGAAVIAARPAWLPRRRRHCRHSSA